MAKEIRKEEHGEGLRSSKQLAVGEAWERRLPWNLKASSLFHSCAWLGPVRSYSISVVAFTL